MTTKEFPKLESMSADYITTFMKGGLGAIPFVGPLMAEIVGNVIPNQRMDRLVQFVQLLQQRLSSLEEDVLRQKLLSPGSVDLLEDAFLLASRATSAERLEHISSVAAIGLTHEEANLAESKRMLWLLGQLNDSEIIILRGSLASTSDEFNADRDFHHRHKEVLTLNSPHLGSTDKEMEKAAVTKSYRQHLHDLGLLSHSFAMPKKGELPEFDRETGVLKASHSQSTLLGRMLLRYLDLLPDWFKR